MRMELMTLKTFKSEKNKFISLYESILAKQVDYHTEQYKKAHYFIVPLKSDCDYFTRVNPKYRVLFVSENKNKQTDYLKATDVFNNGVSKIRKDKTDPNKFYLYEWGSSYTRDYSAEYKSGKWIFKNIGGTNS